MNNALANGGKPYDSVGWVAQSETHRSIIVLTFATLTHNLPRREVL